MELRVEGVEPRHLIPWHGGFGFRLSTRNSQRPTPSMGRVRPLGFAHVGSRGEPQRAARGGKVRSKSKLPAAPADQFVEEVAFRSLQRLDALFDRARRHHPVNEYGI